MPKQLTDEEILGYKDKESTAVQERFADWLIEKLELEFPNAKAEAAFREAVRLATALRMIFQASPENQDARTAARAEREEVRSAKPKKTAKAKPVEDETEDDADARVFPKTKPAKRGRPAKASKVEDDEDSGDEVVAPAPKKSSPRKASARSGVAAPF
jgi:hypothetical protein